MKRFILVLMIFISYEIAAQKTYIYRQPESDYRIGVELYDKKQYGAAQVEFVKVIDAISEPISELKSNSKYYYAICAAELLNGDAEDLLIEYIEENGQSPKAGIARFQLGRMQYRKKEFSKAAQTFEKVDTYYLTDLEFDEYKFKLGYSYFRINRTEDASGLFKEIKDRENQYQIPSLYYYSHIAYGRKNYQAALEGFLKLKNDKHYGKMVPYYIVQIYFMQGKYEDLLKIAPKLLDSGGTKMTSEIARMTGESYYRTGRYKEAIPYFIKFRDNSANGYVTREDDYALAYSYYKTADYKNAVKYFVKVSSGEDSLTQNANYHSGDCYIRTGQKQFARNAFLAANKLPYNKSIQEDALYNYCKLSYELSMNPYNEAIVSIQRYIKEYPNTARTDEMYSYLVNLYLTSRNYRDALVSIESIKGKNEKIKSAYQKVAYNRAIELFNNKDYAGAINLFNKTLTLGKDKKFVPKSLYWKGESFYRLSNLDSALSSYRKFLLTPGSYSLPQYTTANYNIGYCYFKKKNYNEAIIAYRKFVSDSLKQGKEMLNDAYIRLGDCYFITKESQEAIAYYNKAIKLKKADTDYALYQKALALGVINKQEQKIVTLKTLLKDYSKSPYSDDAQFELANTYLAVNDNTNAVIAFEDLIRDYPGSSYVRRSMLKTGLVQRNMENDRQALSTFKKVVSTYPSTPESNEALVSIKNIYVDLNQVDSFFVYVKNIPFANITNAAQDSITYSAAENRFMNGDCDKAISGFEDYLRKYPEGIFVLEANYYRAECLYSRQDYDSALEGYNYVTGKPKSKFTENSLMKAAQINYKKKNYSEAAEKFAKLEGEADYKTNVTFARTGQMRSEYLMNNYVNAIAASRKLLSTPKLANDLSQEAHLTIAKSALAIDSIILAREEFLITNKLGVNEMAAEAKYNLAYIQHLQGKYEESEKQVFDLINQVPSYDYWIARGFILLADNYIKTGNTFQAKQTLQSIVDNYEGEDDLKEAAKGRLDIIVEKERQEEQKKSQMMIEQKFGKDSTETIEFIEEQE